MVLFLLGNALIDYFLFHKDLGERARVYLSVQIGRQTDRDIETGRKNLMTMAMV